MFSRCVKANLAQKYCYKKINRQLLHIIPRDINTISVSDLEMEFHIANPTIIVKDGIVFIALTIYCNLIKYYLLSNFSTQSLSPSDFVSSSGTFSSVYSPSIFSVLIKLNGASVSYENLRVHRPFEDS